MSAYVALLFPIFYNNEETEAKENLEPSSLYMINTSCTGKNNTTIQIPLFMSQVNEKNI